MQVGRCDRVLIVHRLFPTQVASARQQMTSPGQRVYPVLLGFSEVTFVKGLTKCRYVVVLKCYTGHSPHM